MRNYKFTFGTDNETFRNIDSVEMVIKYKGIKYVSKFPISKRMMKYKAYLEHTFHKKKA
jgi:hypothetical protein